MQLVDRNSRFGSEGRVNGVQGKAQSAAIAEAIASICNAAMRVAGAAGTSELAVTVHYLSCTEPETLTTTLVLPASTGTAASNDIFDAASAAIMRGRVGGPWLALTDTSRSV